MKENKDGFPKVQFNWMGVSKAKISLKCTCGETMDVEINLTERTIIVCPSCGEAIFRGEPNNKVKRYMIGTHSKKDE